MIWAYVCMVLGALVWFVPEPVRPFVMVAALAAGAMYFRAMHRRARGDAR